jgi:hypothetical protein
MLLSMPSKKKKEEDINLSEDALLGDLLGKIKPKLPAVAGVKRAPLLSCRPGGEAAAATTAPRPIEERNPFLQRSTGLKKTVLVAPAPSSNVSKSVDTVAADGANADPSQVIEEFESCPMEGFDEEMNVDDIGEIYFPYISLCKLKNGFYCATL